MTDCLTPNIPSQSKTPSIKIQHTDPVHAISGNAKIYTRYLLQHLDSPNEIFFVVVVAVINRTAKNQSHKECIVCQNPTQSSSTTDRNIHATSVHIFFSQPPKSDTIIFYRLELIQRIFFTDFHFDNTAYFFTPFCCCTFLPFRIIIHTVCGWLSKFSSSEESLANQNTRIHLHHINVQLQPNLHIHSSNNNLNKVISRCYSLSLFYQEQKLETTFTHEIHFIDNHPHNYISSSISRLRLPFASLRGM